MSFARLSLAPALPSRSTAPDRWKIEVLAREERMSRRESSQGDEGRVDMQRKENRSKKALSIIYTQSAIIFKYVGVFLRVNIY